MSRACAWSAGGSASISPSASQSRSGSVGEAIELVGRQVPRVAPRVPAHDALALEAAHELDEQQRHALRALDEVRDRRLGHVLRGQEQPPAERASRSRVERPRP